MLQRKQTLWLLLAAVCISLSFKLPIYLVGEKETIKHTDVNATDAVYTIVSGIAAALLCLAAIFMYRRLKLQFQVTLLAALMALLHLILLYVSAASVGHGSPSLYAILPMAAPLFIFAAASGIRRDRKILEEAYRNRIR